MSNPYQAPSTPIPATPGAQRPALVVIGMVCAILTALVPTLVVPSFGQTFSAFGADLPWPTLWLLRAYPALWILPVIVLAVWRFWPRPDKRRLAAFWTGLTILVLGLPACVVALYAPIFLLAKTI